MYSLDMKNNQNGFSVVEGLLILVIVGILSGTGLYVWNSNKKTNETLNNVDSSAKTSTAQSSVKIPSNWVRYQNKNLGIGFAYPKMWTFEKKSKELSSTESHYLGELISEDKATSIAITLVRKQDGRSVRSSIDEWKVYAQRSKLKYSNLTEIKSNYISFSYILNANGATALIYEVLEPDNNVEMVIIPADSNQKATVEQIINTMRLE
jgi:Tfp pilus assembly protein PilX